MAEGKSSGGGSWLGNPNALLALITVVGGFWLVSHELRSDRPVPQAGYGISAAGDQKLEARLWEDPFRADDANSRNGAQETTEGLATLVDQIRRKSSPPEAPDENSGKSASPAADVLLLPVMISGGQYSEDQESRIRSRYAIVSALGRSDYVPDDAEHLGSIRIPWLSWPEIEKAQHVNQVVTHLWEEASEEKKLRTWLLGIEPSSSSPTLLLRYEWYRPRTFAAGRAGERRPAILLLWLDDSFFEDHPLLRLAMLLERLVVPDEKKPEKQLEVALIGPRRSSTLRAMLPNWKAEAPSAQGAPNLDGRVKDVLKHITIYNATVSAMDEVLVRTAPDPKAPRAQVDAKLREVGFRGFHNYAATDAQLAEEAMNELALRGADLGNPENHLVLISEWDTFYARMLSLTYSAELSRRQVSRDHDPAADGVQMTRAEYIEKFTTVSDARPGNFHSFVYLRGLDGQTVGGSVNRDKGSQGRQAAASLEDLRRWQPDVNKAEGQAQFDYLGRLADRVADLQQSLSSQSNEKEKHQIKAIGIVGSDVYDTLLILQALRRRFPAVLFFTTDLDVRFMHPSEREWARNLIVASSYGLALHPSLQDPIPPFRDSTQTAQFAAALAALGNENLCQLKLIPPRRFEIGNNTAVDFSADAPKPDEKSDFRLHPLTASETYRAHSRHSLDRLRSGILAAVLLLGGACWLCESLRRLTWRGRAFPGRSLAFTDEDIGGPEGARVILQGIAAVPEDKLAQWFGKNPPFAKLRAKLEALPPEKPGEVNWEREAALAELVSILVGLCNRLLQQKETGDDPRLLAMPVPSKWKGLNPAVRTRLDKWLEAVVKAGGPQDMQSGDGRLKAFACGAAHTAREGAHALYRAHRRRWQWFLGCVAVFGLLGYVLAKTIWFDTFQHAAGEPFSLVSGTSAWPAVIVRIAIVVLAVWFGFALWHQTEETFLVLTRRYRFATGVEARRNRMGSTDAVPEEELGDRVSAESAWEKYRRDSKLTVRGPIILGTTLLYFIALMAMWKTSGAPAFSPARGSLILQLNSYLGYASAISFMLLAFMAVDKAVLCRRFIRELGTAPTLYGKTTCRHFARQMGRINDNYLDEWIDLQLIADLTERVGRLIYYPAILVLMMLLARNSWWDAWPWPFFLYIVYGFNFTLALASIVILQGAARDAKRVAEQSLEGKVRKLKAGLAPSAAANDAAREEELLKEVQALNRGAFVPFWENPVVGAIFLSSGGTTMLQLFIWFVSR